MVGSEDGFTLGAGLGYPEGLLLGTEDGFGLGMILVLGMCEIVGLIDGLELSVGTEEGDELGCASVTSKRK